MASEVSDSGLFHDKKHISTVFDTLNKQRLSPKLCDVILQIFDFQIYAHSCVLAAASPYFEVLFHEDTSRVFSPKSPQLIEIQIDGQSDFAYKTAVDKIVNFMYTCEIQLDNEKVAHILEISRIMQMHSIISTVLYLVCIYVQHFYVIEMKT